MPGLLQISSTCCRKAAMNCLQCSLSLALLYYVGVCCTFFVQLFKAIRDGVIEATINHADGYVQSKVTSSFTYSLQLNRTRVGEYDRFPFQAFRTLPTKICLCNVIAQMSDALAEPLVYIQIKIYNISHILLLYDTTETIDTKRREITRLPHGYMQPNGDNTRTLSKEENNEGTKTWQTTYK